MPQNSKRSKPQVLNFQEQRLSSEMDEATVARINKMVISRVDDALVEKKERGRSNKRKTTDGKAYQSRGNSAGRRDGSAIRRDYSANRGRQYSSSNSGTASTPSRLYNAGRDTGRDKSRDRSRDKSRDRSRDRDDPRTKAPNPVHVRTPEGRRATNVRGSVISFRTVLALIGMEKMAL